MRFDWNGSTLVTLHNFGATRLDCTVGDGWPTGHPVEIWSDQAYDGSKANELQLAPNGYRWLRWSEDTWVA